MKTVVSGGAGFIGSHLVDALADRGESVLVLDDLTTGRRSNLEGALAGGVELAEGSITDPGFVADRVSRFAPDRIFHLAAQVDVRKAVADPAFDARVNVIGTINLLEAAKRLDSAAFVFASTGGAIYGEGDGRRLPFTEGDEAAPEAAYGVSKLAGEEYVALYRRLYGVTGLALRFGNVFGPRQDPQGEAGVVAIFCGRLRSGEPLTVYGDGRQTRDYVYVGDVVDAVLAAGDLLTEGSRDPVGPYNIGTGVETDLLDLIALLEEVSGVRGEYEHRPRRKAEVERVAIDPAAAVRDLHWHAQTSLADGLRKTYRALTEPGR